VKTRAALGRYNHCGRLTCCRWDAGRVGLPRPRPPVPFSGSTDHRLSVRSATEQPVDVACCPRRPLWQLRRLHACAAEAWTRPPWHRPTGIRCCRVGNRTRIWMPTGPCCTAGRFPRPPSLSSAALVTVSSPRRRQQPSSSSSAVLIVVSSPPSHQQASSFLWIRWQFSAKDNIIFRFDYIDIPTE